MHATARNRQSRGAGRCGSTLAASVNPTGAGQRLCYHPPRLVTFMVPSGFTMPVPRILKPLIARSAFAKLPRAKLRFARPEGIAPRFVLAGVARAGVVRVGFGCVKAALLGVLLFFWLAPLHAATAPAKADMILVNKSERKLYLLRDGEPFRAYRIALGPRPWGHKQQEGDDRTPEGRYFLDFKKSDSPFYRAIRISYPNLSDRLRAQAQGVDPGGAIMIHGQPEGSTQPPEFAQIFNWTSGCIAVTNAEMDEIWAAVDVGTPIEIRP